jgi:hypothetical protein
LSVRNGLFAEKRLLSQTEVAGEGGEQVRLALVMLAQQVQFGQPNLTIHGASDRDPQAFSKIR